MPRRASRAGTAVRDSRAALATAAMAPKPRDRITACGKTSMPANAQIRSSPEKTTVRPAVDTVRTVASIDDDPVRSSSRNRLTMNSP